LKYTTTPSISPKICDEPKRFFDGARHPVRIDEKLDFIAVSGSKSPVDHDMS